MATLTIEIEDELLADAERSAKNQGTNLRQVLMWYIEAFSEGKRSETIAEVLTWATQRGFRIAGDMPSRDERMAR